ncbi:MAG: cytochrome c biogenesis protein CcdA [Euryarchaeota archaeon]|nr:cytochrome c biogenesis protein CcdA [Euryarchaeota archaeon]
MAEPSLVLAFLAGAVSVATPCILPVLPPLLAGSVGSRLRPLAIVLGMSFTFTLMGGAFSALGLLATPLGDALRYIAVGFIILFGAVMVEDSLHSLFVRGTSALSRRFTLSSAGDESLGGALLLGMSLGVVWIPCVGPVLGSILSFVAMEGSIVKGSVLLFAYSLGFGSAVLAIAYGSRRYASRLEWFRKNSEHIRRAAGWVIILTGVAILLGLDRKLMALLLPYFPALL